MRTLVFSDIHEPFGHPNYLRFLKEVRDKYKPDKIVLNGDGIDNYAWSSFSTDPDKQSQSPELQAAKKGLAKYMKEFPEVYVTKGNHDDRPWRKLQHAGISGSIVKPFEEIYGFPEGWTFQDQLTIDGVLYDHGVNAGGDSGWQNADLKYGQSVVFGHYHSLAGIRFHARSTGKYTFTMGTGCGIDPRTYAFMYNRNSPRLPILACGIVEDGENPQLITMPENLRKTRRKAYE